jgi:2-dehydro-3-deoxy-D-gluconate 5-dehydrogenase
MMNREIKPIQDLFNLTGKSIIVTGGAMGIGEGIALRLAEAGASVMVMDMEKEAAAKTVKSIQAKGGKAEFIIADSRKVNDAEKVIKAAVEAFGCLDILVNNAGIYPVAPALQVSEEIWDNVFDTNLKGMFFFSQCAAREMIRAGRGGKLINLASIDGINPGEGRLIYGASKAGVINLTKALALELSPYKILVNAIAPGAIHTPGLVQILDIYARVAGISAEALEAADAKTSTPLGYYGQPDDIAKGVLFLASEASNYMTGHTLVMDGGKLLK